MDQELVDCNVDAHRNIENQLVLQVRLFESAMTQPGFDRNKGKLLATAQDVYWGALMTLLSMDKPEREQFAPIHTELKRLRSTLTAFKM